MNKHHLIPPAFATSDVEPVAVIKTENGPVRIPLSQYNDKQHELHTADEHHDEHGVARNHHSVAPIAPVAGAALAAPVAPIAPVASGTATPARQYGVLQNKNKFFIVNQDGSPATDVPAFDPKGYGSNKEAWEAIAAAALATSADNSGQAS